MAEMVPIFWSLELLPRINAKQSIQGVPFALLSSAPPGLEDCKTDLICWPPRSSCVNYDHTIKNCFVFMMAELKSKYSL